MQSINFESAFHDAALKARYEAIRKPCNVLASDVMFGPYYVTNDPESGTEHTALGMTVRVCYFGEDGITGSFFESEFANKLCTEVRDIVSDLPRYYCPDFDGWTDKEPEAEWIHGEDCDEAECDCNCEDGYLSEPDEYFEVSETQWFGFFFSERTQADIMG